MGPGTEQQQLVPHKEEQNWQCLRVFPASRTPASNWFVGSEMALLFLGGGCLKCETGLSAATKPR